MRKTSGALVTMAVALLVAVPASAEGVSPCNCVQPLSEKAVVGSITAANRDVLMSVAEGLAPATVGSSLIVGSRILVGPAGAGAILVGASCQLSLSAASTVEVGAKEGSLCVRTTALADSPSTTFSSTGRYGQAGANGQASDLSDDGTQLISGVPNQALLGGALGVGAIGGIIAIAAGSDSDNSPPVSLGE
ncbi:hypothetical protein GTW51_22560 [Aurantimonas aggregata]|uniref:Uncharacterized protein n=1 Tax=Aurantimonas aggregata TaxID=2047720 RepID=A0A6L9MNP4_9HYPH|nr:hypothetical protein [Aurantimonas aggregata]NDV89433.1 hypothetical protein [Aurantimonas aggregata]